MKVGLRLLPSNVRRGEPGHVSLTIHTAQEKQVKGLWPLENAFPVDVKNVRERLSYLKNHVVPGVVRDDLLYSRAQSQRLVEQEWPVTPQQAARVMLKLKASALVSPPYSLRPDRFPGSENCVSWCVAVINQALAPQSPLPENPRGNITALERELSRT
jgi:hypothetical protein